MPRSRLCRSAACAGVLMTSFFTGVVARSDTPPRWLIHSPMPAQRVPNGEVFVAVAVDDSTALDPRSVSLFLDERDLTRQATVTTRRISLLYTASLAPGPHEIHVAARDTSGRALPDLWWQFTVEGRTPGRDASGRPAFALSGFTSVDSRNGALSGPGIDLRQDPLQTQALSVDVTARYGNFTFPVRLYLTSEEDASLQPRNRVQVGAQSRWLSVFYGDNAPVFDLLTMNGARTRGLQGALHAGWFHLNVVHGVVRRGIEGRLLDALPSDPLPSDSADFASGTYRRRLTAIRVAFGRERGLRVGLHGLKAKDDVGSIRLGRAPKENLAAGTDLTLRLFDDRLRAGSGVALSLTTHDISRGPLSRADADSLVGVELPFDPADFEPLITLNASTVPLNLRQLRNAVAWYVRTEAALGTHLMAASYQSVGAVFYSFGNPFLQNDRYTLDLTDRFYLPGRRVAGHVRVSRYGTPPRSDALASNLEGTLLSGNVTVAPWSDGPRLHAGYRYQQRSRTDPATEAIRSDSRLHGLSLGGSHRFRTGDFGHGLNLYWTYAVRRDRFSPAADNTTHTLSGGLTEELPVPLVLNLQATRLRIRSDALGALQNLTTLTGRVSYRLPARRLRLSAAARNTHSSPTAFSGASNRSNVYLSTTYDILQGMSLEVQVGYSAYREDGRPENRYDERYLLLRHQYTF